MCRFGTLVIALVLSAGLCLSIDAAWAQTRPERRAVEKAAPVYPELAKRVHLKGVVKMEVVVRPNGSVKSAKALGGNPVLIESATDAVRKWKFEPSTDETTEIVQLGFEPH